MNVLTRGVKQKLSSSSAVVILQWGLVIVENGQGTGSLDEEIVVQASMLVVVHDGRPVGGHVLGSAHRLALQDASVAQQHVRHLEH